MTSDRYLDDVDHAYSLFRHIASIYFDLKNMLKSNSKSEEELRNNIIRVLGHGDVLAAGLMARWTDADQLHRHVEPFLETAGQLTREFQDEYYGELSRAGQVSRQISTFNEVLMNPQKYPRAASDPLIRPLRESRFRPPSQRPSNIYSPYGGGVALVSKGRDLDLLEYVQVSLRSWVYQWVYRWMGRSLARTTENYPCSVPLDAKKGDVVVFLSGFHVPFVLSSVNETEYKLIGKAFIDINGSWNTGSGGKSRTIRIV
jgi:hypothetical protein